MSVYPRRAPAPAPAVEHTRFTQPKPPERQVVEEVAPAWHVPLPPPWWPPEP